ncbi:MAG TPA: hydroxymethylbilane synthase [Flavisolibacter sp.]
MLTKGKVLRIGTRESQLAVWQATTVQDLLKKAGCDSELVYIKSEGDVDTVTPLYELGVQGVFTKTLDAALLSGRIDLAVHSMKDVPTAMARGIRQAAVLERASYKDILVYKCEEDLALMEVDNRLATTDNRTSGAVPPSDSSHPSSVIGHPSSVIPPRSSVIGGRLTVATSSIRRIAQWLNRYPGHRIENLRGNVNTRLRKLEESNWNAAIFAAAGLERIGLRPANSIDLDWMLPAPAQGAIMVVCRVEDEETLEACRTFNHEHTALCAGIERDFLRTLLGGCSTPISALAQIKEGQVYLKGNILSPDGKMKAEVERTAPLAEAAALGVKAAGELLQNGGTEIVEQIRQKDIPHDKA